MKSFKFTSLLLVFSGLLTLAACSSLQSKKSGYQLPTFTEVQGAGNMPILLVPDKSLPYFSLVMLVKSGSTSDPTSKSGLAVLTTELLDKGSKTRSATQVADALGQLGAEFQAAASSDYILLSTGGLSIHQNQLIDNFFDILLNPAFKKSEFVRAQKKLLSGLSQLADQPQAMAQVAFEKYLFANNPYGRPTNGTFKDVQKITQKDVESFYKQNFLPNNAMLAVVGQYDEAAIKRINAALANWKEASVSQPEFVAAPEITTTQYQFVDKSDLAQSQIRFGHLGIKRTDPDFLKLRLATNILGGSFSSRLMKEIRVKRGLTYSINSEFDAKKEVGPFQISTFTRHDKVGETIAEVTRTLSEFVEKGVTEAEVESTKALLKGIFPRALETPEKLAQNLLLLRFYGISDSYLTDYLKNIESLKASEINAAIKKHIQPNQMKVVVYGSKVKVDTQLIGLPNVEYIKYDQVF